LKYCTIEVERADARAAHEEPPQAAAR